MFGRGANDQMCAYTLLLAQVSVFMPSHTIAARLKHPLAREILIGVE